MSTDQIVHLDLNAIASTSRSKNANQSVNLYAELPSLKNQRLKFTSGSPFTPTYVQSHLTTSDPAGTYASRIAGKHILLENPAKESKQKKEREEKKTRRKDAKKRKAAGVFGRRMGIQRGVWKFDKEQAKFELFVPLHHLWLGYMSELLGISSAPPPSNTPRDPAKQSIPSAAGMHVKLVKADFHGSLLTVKQAKNPALVGLSGIVILESENAFRVVTKKDQVKLLPKQNTIFTFSVPLHSTLSLSSAESQPQTQNQLLAPSLGLEGKTVLDIPHIEFELYGNQFRFRSAERAARKFKSKETIEL